MSFLLELDQADCEIPLKELKSIFVSPDGALQCGNDIRFLQLCRDLKYTSRLPDTHVRWIGWDTRSGNIIVRKFTNKMIIKKKNGETKSWNMPKHATGRNTLSSCGRLIVISSPMTDCGCDEFDMQTDLSIKSCLEVYTQSGKLEFIMDLRGLFETPKWICRCEDSVILTNDKSVGRFTLQEDTRPEWVVPVNGYATAVQVDERTGFICVAAGIIGKRKIMILAPEGE